MLAFQCIGNKSPGTPQSTFYMKNHGNGRYDHYYIWKVHIAFLSLMNVALQLRHLIRIIRPLYKWQQWHKLKWCSCLKCFTCWHLHFVTVNGNKCQYWTIIVRDFWSVKHPIQHFKTFILQGQLITDAANYEYTIFPSCGYMTHAMGHCLCTCVVVFVSFLSSFAEVLDVTLNYSWRKHFIT